jgi:hypothetical protein
MMETASKDMMVIKGIASCIVVLLCLAGCSNVTVLHSRGSCGPMDGGDALTLVLDYRDFGRSLEEADTLEAGLSECLQRALKEGGQAVTLVPPDEFRRVVFPDLDSTSAPRSVETLASILEEPHVRQKIDSLQLRYLITVREVTTSGSELVGGAGGDMGGAFWVIGASQRKTTRLLARIIDIKNPKEPGEINTWAHSSGFYGVFMILPIIVPTVTESPACKRFGREIVRFISGETEDKPAGDTP